MLYTLHTQGCFTKCSVHNVWLVAKIIHRIYIVAHQDMLQRPCSQRSKTCLCWCGSQSRFQIHKKTFFLIYILVDSFISVHNTCLDLQYLIHHFLHFFFKWNFYIIKHISHMSPFTYAYICCDQALLFTLLAHSECILVFYVVGL